MVVDVSNEPAVLIFRAKIGNGSSLNMEAALSSERQKAKGKVTRCQNSENSSLSFSSKVQNILFLERNAGERNFASMQNGNVLSINSLNKKKKLHDF